MTSAKRVLLLYLVKESMASFTFWRVACGLSNIPPEVSRMMATSTGACDVLASRVKLVGSMVLFSASPIF